MKFLLDTCVISDFIKGEKGTLSQIKKLTPDKVTVSSITVMELEYGLALNPSRAKSIRPLVHDFLSDVHILDFNSSDAKEAALLRASLKQQGKPIGSYDILLAGVALNRKLILVSANAKEFNRLDGLIFENWRL